jgi:hypothetical protein
MKTFLWVVLGVLLLILLKLKFIFWGLGLIGAAGFLHFSLNRIDTALKVKYPEIKSFWGRVKYKLKNKK